MKQGAGIEDPRRVDPGSPAERAAAEGSGNGFRLTLGADYLGDGRARFRVWAPDRQSVEVCLEGPAKGPPLPLARGVDGYFEGTHPAAPGDRYRYRLDGGPLVPDPCSRFQPEGPHGPSEIVDPRAFRWTDEGWAGLTSRGQVLYELHVGAFSPEGTYAGVTARLPYLKELGVTAIELMPVNTFPGRFNWGYDGVSLFAPCAAYGTPDELRRLVDEAHRLGLGVLLDVVYNHLGPDGNYLGQYAASFFSDRHPHLWGAPPDFDGPRSAAVRDFFIQNAAYWLSEFHLDGLRLDATQQMADASERHVVMELGIAARAAVAPRQVLLFAENVLLESIFIYPLDQGGFGLDGLWVEDFHHAASVAVGGPAEGHQSDFRGTARELLACALRNALYQGQWCGHRGGPRGNQLWHLPPEQMVFYLQNHDEVGNTLRGERLQVAAGLPRMRALTTFWLLLPQTPMLFMGQEYFSSTPFTFFADHHEALQRAVERGRASYFDRTDSARHALEHEGYRLSCGEESFRRSRLDWREQERNAPALLLHRELLRLRREDPALRSGRVQGATLSEHALVLRYSGERQDEERLLLLNLGTDLRLEPCPEPLLAPPHDQRWGLVLSSEECRFGGGGARYPTGEGPWLIPGPCAVVLAPVGGGGSRRPLKSEEGCSSLRAPTNRREPVVGAEERFEVSRVVQVERLIGEPHDPRACRGSPCPCEQVGIPSRIRKTDRRGSGG